MEEEKVKLGYQYLDEFDRQYLVKSGESLNLSDVERPKIQCISFDESSHLQVKMMMTKHSIVFNILETRKNKKARWAFQSESIQQEGKDGEFQSAKMKVLGHVVSVLFLFTNEEFYSLVFQPTISLVKNKNMQIHSTLLNIHSKKITDFGFYQNFGYSVSLDSIMNFWDLGLPQKTTDEFKLQFTEFKKRKRSKDLVYLREGGVRFHSSSILCASINHSRCYCLLSCSSKKISLHSLLPLTDHLKAKLNNLGKGWPWKPVALSQTSFKVKILSFQNKIVELLLSNEKKGFFFARDILNTIFAIKINSPSCQSSLSRLAIIQPSMIPLSFSLLGYIPKSRRLLFFNKNKIILFSLMTNSNNPNSQNAILVKKADKGSIFMPISSKKENSTTLQVLNIPKCSHNLTYEFLC